MKAIIKIIIIFLGTASCQFPINKEQSKIRTFDLKELPKISEVKLSDLGFVDIEYIPLETNELSAMGHFGLRAVGYRFIAGNTFYIIKLFSVCP